MVPIEDVLLYAIAQQGKPYLLGAEADAADPDPPRFDCSELVQWACDHAGVEPAVPDGAYWQYRHCALSGQLISVDDAIATRGALLFRETSSPPTRFDDVPHVAWSLGDGMTFEARGRAWGVGSWAAPNRFQAAGMIPGIDYTPAPLITPEQAEELMPPAPATCIVDGDEFTFVRGTDGALWVSRRAGHSQWETLAPHDGGGIITSGPFVVPVGDGRILVKARGNDGATWRLEVSSLKFEADGTPKVVKAWESEGGQS